MRHLARLLSVAAALCVVAEPVVRGQAPTPPSAAQAERLSQMADQVAAEVEQLRGWKFKQPVRRERVDVKAFRRHVEKQIDLTLPAARRGVTQAFLRIAGLIPPDCDLLSAALAVLEQQVAGYYDPATGTLYLVDLTEPMPELMQRIVLAHELAHGLDDQQVGLRAMVEPAPSRSEDAQVVLSSLGEGSATSLMFHYLLRQASGGLNSPELTAFFAKEADRAKILERMPRYFNAMFATYTIGAAFLAKGDLAAIFTQPDDRATGESFRMAWASPPRSSEQILHPAKYWSDAARDEPVVIDDASAEAWLGRPGRQVIHRDTLGELLTALLTAPPGSAGAASQMMSPSAWTNAGAAGWGGDRFYLMASGSTPEAAGRDLKDLRGVWITTWDSAAERAEFLRSLEAGSPPPGYSAVTAGTRTAILFVGFEGAERDAMMQRVLASPPKMTKGGQAWEW